MNRNIMFALVGGLIAGFVAGYFVFSGGSKDEASPIVAAPTAPTMFPWTTPEPLSVAPAASCTLPPAGQAPATTLSVPWLTTVPPEYELLPESVTIPLVQFRPFLVTGRRHIGRHIV